MSISMDRLEKEADMKLLDKYEKIALEYPKTMEAVHKEEYEWVQMLMKIVPAVLEMKQSVLMGCMNMS